MTMNKQNKVISMIMVFGSIILSASDDGFSTPPQTPRNQNHNILLTPEDTGGARSSQDFFTPPPTNISASTAPQISISNTGADPLTPENTRDARDSQDIPPTICMSSSIYLEIENELKELINRLKAKKSKIERTQKLVSKNFPYYPEITGFLFEEKRLNKAEEFSSEFPGNNPKNNPKNDPKKLAEIKHFLNEDTQPVPALGIMNHNNQQYGQSLLQPANHFLAALPNMPLPPDPFQAQQNLNLQTFQAQQDFNLQAFQAQQDFNLEVILDLNLEVIANTLMHNRGVSQEAQSTESPSDTGFNPDSSSSQ